MDEHRHPRERRMTIAAGFADPALGAQATFRCLLRAIAHPGRIVLAPQDLPTPPAPLLPPAYAAALTLLDFETPLWIDPSLARPAVLESLRLHCGCPIVAQEQARFALLAGRGSALTAFEQGTSEYPDRSATLIWQVGQLSDARGVRLTGPGIRNSVRLQVEGLPADFWALWGMNHTQFPLGVDVVFVTTDCIAALPRSTQVEA
jgi:alpha-D-ribose 1-methylphosphonate 5-triphosphate synthase subunit PhnH